MTEKEAFEHWWNGGFMTQNMRSPDEWAHMAWHAALAWARSQQEPVAWIDRLDREENAETFMGCSAEYKNCRDNLRYNFPLYAAPAAPTVPKGWKLVPEEPTHEMVRTACEEIDETGVRWQDMRVAWAEMLAAAPEYKEGE